MPVTRATATVLGALAGLCIVAALGLGWYFDTRTDAAFPYWDNAIFAMSLAAMWLTAQKKIENWMVWLVVNVASVGVYFAQDIPLYAALYAVYIPMAVWGYVTWLKSMGGAGARGA